MGIAIRFVGGPADGRTLTIDDREPPLRYRIPKPVSIADLMNAALVPVEPVSNVADDYDLQWDGMGLARRADDGAYLYRHHAASVSPEDRQAMETARREAREAEDRRAVELDETWQEIRTQRPNFPADWRDL